MRLRHGDGERLYQIYLKGKTHKGKPYEYLNFVKTYKKHNNCINTVMTKDRVEARYNRKKPLNKEEFEKIDYIYGLGYKRPGTIQRLTGIGIGRIKKYYFYNLV